MRLFQKLRFFAVRQRELGLLIANILRPARPDDGRKSPALNFFYSFRDD